MIPDKKMESATQDKPFAPSKTDQKSREYDKTQVKEDFINETASVKYHHDDLPDAKTYIRLLEVLGDLAIDDTTTKLACALTVWPVSEAPSYHAISYAWGDKRLTTNVSMNGKELEVTINSDYALRQSQWHGRVQYIWIDSICIDQVNNNEKGHQVEMMGDIFRNASHVLACVGSHADASELVMSVPFWAHSLEYSRISPMKDALVGNIFTKTLLRSRNFRTLMWIVRIQLVDLLKLLKAFLTFMERPYFTRVWIVQELFMAKRTSMCCGAAQRPVEELFSIIRNFSSFYFSRPLILSLEHSATSFLPAPLRLLKYLSRSQIRIARRECATILTHRALKHFAYGISSYPTHNSLYSLILNTRELRCEDPRDKVYSLLAMTKWNVATPIIPDYSATVFEVAEAAQRKMMQEMDASIKDLKHFDTRPLGLARLLVEGLDLRHVPESMKSMVEISRGRTGWWYSCKITHSSSNGWKLDIRSEKKYHHENRNHNIFCLYSYIERARLAVNNSVASTSSDHVQVLDHEGRLIALLPRNTQPGDFLCCCEEENIHLVLRQDPTNPQTYTIVGLAILGDNECMLSPATTGPWFVIHFDALDALRLMIVRRQDVEYGIHLRSFLSREVEEKVLEFQVCRLPGSSFARRHEIAGFSQEPRFRFFNRRNPPEAYKHLSKWVLLKSPLGVPLEESVEEV